MSEPIINIALPSVGTETSLHIGRFSFHRCVPIVSLSPAKHGEATDESSSIVPVLAPTTDGSELNAVSKSIPRRDESSPLLPTLDNVINPTLHSDASPLVSAEKGTSPGATQSLGPFTTTALPRHRPSLAIYEIQRSTDQQEIPLNDTDTIIRGPINLPTEILSRRITNVYISAPPLKTPSTMCQTSYPSSNRISSVVLQSWMVSISQSK